MSTHLQLRTLDLRYVLVRALRTRGPLTVAQLVKELDRQGFSSATRTSKAISDALRTDVALGRVYRLRRGLYRIGEIPRSTEYRIIRRVEALRVAAGRARANESAA